MFTPVFRPNFDQISKKPILTPKKRVCCNTQPIRTMLTYLELKDLLKDIAILDFDKNMKIFSVKSRIFGTPQNRKNMKKICKKEVFLQSRRIVHEEQYPNMVKKIFFKKKLT